MGSRLDVLGWTMSPAAAGRLRELLGRAVTRPGAADWYDLPAWVHKRFPAGVAAIVGYGSWYAPGLRKPASFPDVYVVVDDYARIYEHALPVWWNRFLPPNVYYVWTEGEGRHALRGKYNVISQADLARECGTRLRDVYNAGRLTKLVWLAWTRDDAMRTALIGHLLDAHAVLAAVALPGLPERFSRRDFSLELLALSYRGEARLEGWERVRVLYEAHREHYEAAHAILLDAFAEATGLIEIGADGVIRRVADPAWRTAAHAARHLVRRSRRRGYLRWPRIVLTEPNLLDLAVNEAERKAGVQIRVTPRLRRHPLLYGLPEFLRVLRARRAHERIGPRHGA
jgi:hypothetical protein